jgi:hypothetical protein
MRHTGTFHGVGDMLSEAILALDILVIGIEARDGVPGFIVLGVLNVFWA